MNSRRRHPIPATTHLLNFMAVMAPKVESGRKRQTMRPKRKRPIRVGDTLRLYTGLRHTGARLLGTAICIETTPVVLSAKWMRLGSTSTDIHFYDYDSLEAERFARADGFNSPASMRSFFFTQYKSNRVELDCIKWGKLIRHHGQGKTKQL